jgi:energy-converting hydrogenase Eha subunit A
MRVRLVLEPPWVRFLVWASLLAVAWGLWVGFASHSTIQATVMSALYFGIFVGAAFTYMTQSMHKALNESIAELSQPERSAAIAAVLHGVRPSDTRVRLAAIKLGWASLGGKSPQQLKRQERQSWIASAILVTLGIAAGATRFVGVDSVYYLALVFLGAVVLPFGVLSIRRTQRNVALLTEGPIA